MNRFYIPLLAAIVTLCAVSCDDPYDYTEYLNWSGDDDDDGNDITDLSYLNIDYTSLDMYVGEEQTLVVTPYPTDIANVALTWSTDNEAVATVSSSGEVKAVGYGDATITATSTVYETIYVNCSISVDESVEYTLATIPADGSSIDSNSWIISDSGTPSYDSFASLREALYSAGRDIHLEFPNIEGFPAQALYYPIVEEEQTEEDTTDDEEEEDTPYFALAAVIAPNATTVGKEAFMDCYVLATIDMSAVNSIGAWGFANCLALTAIDIPLITEIVEGAFYNCSSIVSADFPLVTSVATKAFYSCDELVNVELPLITTIPDQTFSWCISLESINAPLVESIGYWGFGGCRSLLSLDMPEVVSVGDFAIYNGLSITDINFAAAESIGENAFYSCAKMTTLNLASTSSDITIDTTAFTGVYTRDYVTLTTSANNGTTISGTTWIVGELSLDFLALYALN